MLTIPAGSSGGTITLSVLGDLVTETDEIFFVDFTAVTGATLSETTGQVTLSNRALRIAEFGGKQSATYRDAAGNAVTLKISGPGKGTALFDEFGPPNADALAVLVQGTTSASALTITSRGATNVSSIEFTAPVGKVTAKTTNLLRDLRTPGGLKTLMLGGATGIGSHVIDLGASPGASVVLGNASNLSLRSAAGLKSVKVRDWARGFGDDVLAVPAIGSISALGNWGVDVSVGGDVGTMKVGGALTANVRAGGNIGTITAGSIVGSKLYAGVRPDQTDLPTGPADFPQMGASIRSVTARGAIRDSYIAAPSLGVLKLARVEPLVAVSADRIANFAGTSAARGRFKLSRLDEIADTVQDDAMLVLLF